LQTQDGAGNWNDPETVFVFRFDDTPPPNPPRPAIEAHNVQDGEWQGVTSQPDFTWIPVEDPNGIAQYKVFWGTDQDAAVSFVTAASYSVPEAVDSGDVYYLNVLAQDGCGNWSAEPLVYDPTSAVFEFRYDDTPPTSPSRPADCACSPGDGMWQNSCQNPTFTWDNATDDGEIAGYEVYWGADPAGLPVEYVATARYAPDPVESGVYYLRVRTLDAVGHTSSVKTLYEFRYDSDVPGAPSRPAAEAHNIQDGVWQNTVDDPAFTWSGAADTLSGVAGYRVYWGTNAGGTPNEWRDVPEYDPGPVSAGVYYLRVSVEDVAGNVSDPVTLFTFRYDDDSPPATVRPATEEGGAQDGVWQNSITSPSFVWDEPAGADHYLVYWGTNPAGVPALNLSAPAYAPAPISGDGVYYLRVQVVDGAGNKSAPVTMFEFRYDGTAPHPPTDADEQNGITDGDWTAMNTPSFDWGGASDDHSGVAGYVVYWGTDPDGTPNVPVSVPSFTPGAPGVSGTYYLRVASVDVAGNTGAATTLFTFRYDETPPTNPVRPAVEAGETQDGVWQNNVTAPVFTWSGVSDAHSGLAGYYVYFGLSPNGEPAEWTASASYAPGEVSTSGTYYLRLKAVDDVGHASEPVTLFEFRYDSDVPGAPSRPATEAGGAQDGVWQGSVSAPSFTWGGATDAHSNVAGYEVYWGTNPAGEPVTFTVSSSYTPPPVTANGVYYLRVRAVDGAGNKSPVATLFDFRYDSTPPTNPNTVDEGQGTASGLWTAVSEPEFWWGGAHDALSDVVGYRVYWGMSEDGVPDTWVTAPEYAPAQLHTSGVYYLRVSTEDGAGNRSTPATLFEYRYDGDAPVAVTRPVTETHGIEDGSWQNVVNDPAFTWGGAADAHSGVMGYEVYWGTNPGGEPSELVTSPAYAPPSVPDGVYYLRLSAVDDAGNRTTPVTVFEFRYDSVPPSPPVRPATEMGGAQDQVWQNDVSSPYFAWSPVAEATEYLVYWGTDPSGLPVESVTHPYYAAGVVGEGTYYLRVLSRDQAGNESVPVTLFEFRYDDTPPTGPTSASENGGGVSSGEWTARADPAFAWSGATDASSDIGGYLVYWGLDPGGDPMMEVTVPGYTPAPLTADGTYYLRVRAVDGAGNVGDIVDLYEYRFDSTSPVVIRPVAETHGVQDRTWRGDVDFPSFVWDDAADRGSGIGGYYIYWGTDAGGSPGEWVEKGDFAPGVVDTGVYYLRALPVDAVGNQGDATTLFEFRYDGAPPTAPTWSVEAGGAQDGVWQNFVTAPHFTWGGAADGESGLGEYRVYWGTSPAGQPAISTTLAGYAPGPVDGDGTYYLRLSSVDRVGNESVPDTLFTFRYDGTPPDAPTVAYGAPGGGWSAENEPMFTWDRVSDLSGISGYEVYWGTSPYGTPGTFVDAAAYTPVSLSEDGTYYLRVRAVDGAGNKSSVATLLEYRYDGTPPGEPANVTEEHGVTDKGWTNISNPEFTWTCADEASGVDYYEVYWGTDPSGQPAERAGDPVFSPGYLDASGNYYLRVRATDNVGNVSTTDTIFEYRFDNQKPGQPSGAVEAHGIESGVWQNSITEPIFVWNSGGDDESGVAGYNVYFGPMMYGPPDVYVADTTYQTSTISDGIYYLRAGTLDRAGNKSPTAALFEFRYDGTPPPQPAWVTENHGLSDGDWSNVTTPAFEWEEVEDGASGVARYRVYWGSDPGGIPNVDLTTPGYTGTVSGDGDYYLRLYVEDQAGNRSAITTVYTLRYDATAPRMPDEAAESHGVEDGSWQNVVNDPAFTWDAADDGGSGVAHYLVYFGSDPAGE
ncbi:MAG: hypothetical protein DRP79_04660, partial [Planctomycetota bacterium]